jgi:hypothetical protein
MARRPGCSLIRRTSSAPSPRSSSSRRAAAAPTSAPRRAAALQGALIAELLVELKAAGHYDVILAEAAAAGPLD